MEFVSPTHGKLSFERMFERIVQYMEEQRDQRYNLIIGTDSLLGDDTCFVTAVVIHRVGHGGRYFYHRFRNRKIESLRQRILFETSLSLETASQISAELAKNGFSELPLEIHLDVGDRGETKRIIREVVGMVQGSGYAAVTKPDSYGASKVADRETGKMGVRPRPLPRPKRSVSGDARPAPGSDSAGGRRAAGGAAPDSAPGAARDGAAEGES
jgi:predicted RNase H-related nuclease YkuK (DUF458 family)